MVFLVKPSLEELNKSNQNTMVDFLGIKFTGIGDDYIEATMPVNEKTKQPMGLLHGGANVVLAETLGSIAASLSIDLKKQSPVGLEINANHVKGVRSGNVRGIAKPVHLGKSTQIWEIKIFNEANQLSCVSRLTMAILTNQ